MFPNVRLLIAAMIATVVVLSCGFGMFAAFRVNHEPFARLPSGAAPLQLLASISPSPPIIVAVVEPLDRGLRTADTRAGIDLVDAQTRAPTVSDRGAGAPAAEPDTSSAPVSANASATMAAQETLTSEPQHETNSPAADAAAGDAAPAPAPALAPAFGVAAVEAPASQSVMIEQAGPDTMLVPASPSAAAKAAKTAAVKKKHTHLAAKAHRTRQPVWDDAAGLATSNTRESTSAIGGPFVSPAAW